MHRKHKKEGRWRLHEQLFCLSCCTDTGSRATMVYTLSSSADHCVVMEGQSSQSCHRSGSALPPVREMRVWKGLL